MTDEDWSGVLGVMLTGPFQMCRAAARLLRAPRGVTPAYHRKVVNISSVNGIYGAAGQANYSAAKAGLIGLTKALAREWASQAVNVNAVAPGYISGTRLTAPRTHAGGAGLPDTAIEKLTRSIPLGRAGTPADIAGVVAFLASSDADYLVGQVLEVHGGREIIDVG
jgi:3-oxoacyl-[acyl-carrier protein] reductase